MALEDFHSQAPGEASWSSHEALVNNDNLPPINGSTAGNEHMKLASDFEHCPASPEEWAKRAVDGAMKEGLDLGQANWVHIHNTVMGIMDRLRKKGSDGDC